MRLKDLIEELLSYYKRCIWMTLPNEMCILGKPIDDHRNDFFAFQRGEAFNEVHGDFLKTVVWDGKRQQETKGGGRVIFVLLAD